MKAKIPPYHVVRVILDMVGQILIIGYVRSAMSDILPTARRSAIRDLGRYTAVSGQSECLECQTVEFNRQLDFLL